MLEEDIANDEAIVKLDAVDFSYDNILSKLYGVVVTGTK